MSKLGKNLRAAREYLGLTQQQVADAMGMYRETVSQIESGIRGVGAEELVSFSRLYKRTVGWLVGDELSLQQIPEEIASRLKDLPDQDCEEIIMFMEFLSQRRRVRESKD